MNTTETNLMRPKSLLEAVRYFSDFSVAHEFFVGMRWPQGVCCPRCGSTAVRYMPNYRRFQCSSNHDGRQFTVKTGTVMEDSPLGLDKWAAALWLEVNAKNSISSYEIHRALDITQKSAWFMLHRIRYALHCGSFDKMIGEVESDESYIGGLAKNMHASKRKAKRITAGVGVGKDVVHGLLQRGTETGNSRVKATVVPDAKLTSLMPILSESVEKGTALYTDSAQVYSNRNITEAFIHSSIDHAQAYVMGRCHTNGLENFWSLFKRTLKGTYVSVESQHLGKYVDEQVFRFNERKLTDAGRFGAIMPGVVGKRLTYKELIGFQS